jgi:hypothetical protein
MKYKYLISLLLLLFCFPIFPNSVTTVLLNGISYETTHPILSKENMIFLSDQDLEALTYASITQKNSTAYEIDLGSIKFDISIDSKNVRIGRETFTLTSPLFIDQDILYLPLEILDFCGIPYHLKDTTLSFSDLIPYSQNIDRVSAHQFREATIHLENLPEQLSIFSTKESILEEISRAKQNKDYIAFLDSTFQTEVHDLLRERLRYSPYNNMQIIIRKRDPFDPYTISSLEVIPMNVKVFSRKLDITIDDTLIPVTSLWTTFYPHESMTDVNLTKTLDVTLMRTIYEYYRNKYGLRDDKFFSPFTIVTSERTNTLIHDAYAIENNLEVDYTIKVHRIHPSGSLVFLVDLYKK